MIGTTEQFAKSRLTQQIDQWIQQNKPTRQQQFDAYKIAEKIGIESPNYNTVKPIKSYLDSLVRKNLLTAYGSDQAMSVMVKIFYIDKPHQETYWQSLK